MTLAIRRRTAGLLAGLALGLAVAGQGVARAEKVTVFAAASLKTAMDEITAGFAAATGDGATVSFAGSSALARQIQQGAPADVFISANETWMDVLEQEGRIAQGTRFDLVRNRLVLIAHGADAPPVEIGPALDLAGLLEGRRLAMALVAAVPAGIYSKAALEALGQWEAVAPLVAQADNVRAALALVALGEAPYGIVYATDAVAEPRVSVAGVFPEDSHPPIIYPVALTAGRDSPAARRFLDYLRGDAARAALAGQGFLPVGE